MGTAPRRRRPQTAPKRRARLPIDRRRLQKKARIGLHAALDDVADHVQKRVSEISKEFGRSKAWVRAHLYGGSKSARFMRRVKKIRLYDAYVHWKSKEMNKDPPDGVPYKLAEIKAKIQRERPNYKVRPVADQQVWLDAYKAHKEATARDKRVNRKGEQQDATSSLKGVSNDLDTLKARTGVVSMVIAVRPEVLFTMEPWVHCDNNTEKFCNVALGKTPDQIARLLEMWTVHGPSGLISDAPKNADEMKSACRRLISSKLDDIIALRYKGGVPPTVKMNYDSYDDAILVPHRVRLLGWTFNGGKFKNPGKLAMVEVRALYNGLIDQSVRWELVPEPGEGEDDVIPITTEKRSRKTRSDKNKKRKPRPVVQPVVPDSSESGSGSGSDSD
ncbi:hypothetical protein EXIGLDRAFT_768196 [Exidia glandulosa HHB12029]|uniref:Uncharacterized protein n=1 Tax=Exidia glandulosa HHB12029 TaxID=1314781 RepID=A0A165IEN3_EXIGL|nr:hypothetical protein EXIGLDRAFT_768196 [Exidia glandulosa HHB12029]